MIDPFPDLEEKTVDQTIEPYSAKKYTPSLGLMSSAVGVFNSKENLLLETENKPSRVPKLPQIENSFEKRRVGQIWFGEQSS
jgi:hypothetical protein